MSRLELSAESLGVNADSLNEKTLLAALAEGIALVLFVFIGAGSVVMMTAVVGTEINAASLTGIALAHGLAIGTLVAATAGISGGHINPAVTFSMVVTGRMKFGPGVVYIAAQCVGAVIGALLLQLVLVDSIEGGLGGHAINDAAVDGTGAAVIVEAILTFVLVFTVFATAVDSRGPTAIAPLMIGVAILIDHIVGVPLTGASMNPARSFGPALATGEWDDQWVYWVGPFIGGALAALTYAGLFLKGSEDS